MELWASHELRPPAPEHRPVPPRSGASESFQADRPQGDIALPAAKSVSENYFLLEFTHETVIKRRGQGARFFCACLKPAPDLGHRILRYAFFAASAAPDPAHA